MSTLLPVLFLVLPLVALAAFQLVMFRRMKQAEGKPAPDLAGSAGDAVRKGHTALFYFYSPTCGPCRAMTPVVKRMQAKEPERVFPIDVSRDLDTAMRFGVMATPTVVVVRDGTVARVQPGAMSPDRLAALLQPTP